MAGRGPPPKNPVTRQRQNRKSTATTLSSQRRGRAPKLDLFDPKREWDPRTRRWWRAVWASPMAAMYLEPDKEELGAVAILKDMFFSHPTTPLAAEIRLQEARFGLTPVDRARLDWVMMPADEASKRPARVAQLGEGDPRDNLRLMAGGKA